MEENVYPKGIRLVIIVTTAIVATLLELIDTTIVNVSLKAISGSLGATTTEIVWVITSYAISNVIIIPMSGMLSNLLGRKIYFTISISLFTIASLMCGLSNSLWMMVFWRFLQGIGGGALMATSQAIIVEAFPPSKLTVGMALFGAGVAMGPAFGPLLGGYLTDSFSWHWIFWVNIPLGILGALSSWFFISDQKERKPVVKFDWWGLLFLVVGVGSLQYVLEEGNTYDWFESKVILTFTILAVLGIIAFIIRELKTDYPITKISLFKHRNVALGAILSFVIGAVLLSVIYAYPLFAQISLGWTATLTGLGLTPGALMTTVGIAIVQRLNKKGVNPKVFLIIGFSITIYFCFMMYSQSPESNWDSLFYPLLCRGLGLSFLMLPMIVISIEGLEGYDLEQGTGISNMIRQLGGAFGLALVSNRISDSAAMFRAELIHNVNDIDYVPAQAMNTISQAFSGNGYSGPEAQLMAAKILDYSVMKQSAVLSYLDSFLVVAIACCIVLPLLFFMKHSKKKDAKAVEINIH
jgi:DHA2 family multidrug resistance protein